MTTELIILCLAAFAAGFVDAIIGGGGLIQTPATLITFPKEPVALLLGTTKIPSFTGTSMAFFTYAKRVAIRWKLLIIMCSLALPAALFGSYIVTHVSNIYMKPVILILLIIVAVYTYTKKSFGITDTHKSGTDKEYFLAAIFAVCIGFYDGFIGPGAGSFMAVFFISMMGFDFLKASAHAKLVNLSTNLGSIILFGFKGLIIWKIAIPMAICNLIGASLGVKLAILKGNKFIRVFFLSIVILTIVRFSYDIFFK